MTPERWRHLKKLFAEAIALEPAARLGFVERECAGDEEMRSELEGLIASHAEAGAFIEGGVPDADTIDGDREQEVSSTTGRLLADQRRLMHLLAREAPGETGGVVLWDANVWLRVVMTAAAVLTAVTGLMVYRVAAGSNAVPVPRQRVSVAIVSFENETGSPESEWLSTAILEMLTAVLAAGEQVRVVPRGLVAGLEAQDAATSIGATYIVSGSFGAASVSDRETIRIEANLHVSARGEKVAVPSRTGTERDLFDLAVRCGADLRSRIGAGGIAPAELTSIRGALPARPGPARSYALALGRLRHSDPAGARDLLQDVVEAEPEFARGHVAFAAAWSALGRDDRAAEEARKAFDQSAGMSREDRLLTEARYREAIGDWGTAAEIYRALMACFADAPEYRMALTRTQRAAGRLRTSPPSQ